MKNLLLKSLVGMSLIFLTASIFADSLVCPEGKELKSKVKFNDGRFFKSNEEREDIWYMTSDTFVDQQGVDWNLLFGVVLPGYKQDRKDQALKAAKEWYNKVNPSIDKPTPIGDHKTSYCLYTEKGSDYAFIAAHPPKYTPFLKMK